MATQAQLDELEAAILADAVTGIKSTTVDGVTVVGLTPKERLEALAEMTPDETVEDMKLPNFGLRSRRLDSPGGWGSR